MGAFLALLAALSVWDYPERQLRHDALRQQFTAAVREGDTATMEETSRKGMELLPDDPTWRYNHACSLAWYPGRAEEALDELEKAIDLGYRDDAAIARDTDLRRLADNRRFGQLVEYAKMMKSRPILTGPMAVVAATGVMGTPVALGEQNLAWDFDTGSFDAKLKLAPGVGGGNAGDLYMNRDGDHSRPRAGDFPGGTEVRFDQEGRRRQMDIGEPNICFPYPLFGNCSRAYTEATSGRFWRSISRAMTTTQAFRLKAMRKFYLSNQIWVIPANADTAPVGTNGDVFASITPYWLTTAGKSWSDLPYLSAAMLASRSMKPDVKRAVVANRLFAPTVMTLIRKSLKGVNGEDDYLTPLAHPTALPVGGVETNRLAAAAAALTAGSVPPLAVLWVESVSETSPTAWPELVYSTQFAWSYVLRAPEEKRVFVLKASGGAKEFKFVRTHGTEREATLTPIGRDQAVVEIRASRLNPTNRVDIALFARNPGTGWGAPSYASFARMDPKAPYSDPALTPRPADPGK